MNRRHLFRALGFLVVLLFANVLFADTIAATSAEANYSSDSKSYQLCPQGSTCIIATPLSSSTGAGTLQSQASDGGASAEAHVNLQTGSMGVAASGWSSAEADFSNAFYCVSTSPCETVATGGVRALMHMSMDGTITPPSVFDDANNTYGGYLEVGFSYSENDIGGGSMSFNFETDYDDTLDHPPTVELSLGGQQFYPTFTYDTQADGTVKFSVDWTQPFTICPYGCSGVAQHLYSISSGGAEGSLFGTVEKAYVVSDGLGGADFSHTFTTSITSLDPRYSFFSDSGLLVPTQSSPVPEPASIFLFSSGLIGLAWRSRRRR